MSDVPDTKAGDRDRGDRIAGVKVMGVVNVTPDSFSDGGRYLDPDAAALHASMLFDAGAVIVDVGGESTRPGAKPVSAEDEAARVVPVIERLRRARPAATISIDTMKLEVAERAVRAGATYVNDVSAFEHDPEMAGFVADAKVDCCLMHMQGEPRTMQADPTYGDVVDDVRAYLEQRLEFATSEGVPEERIQLDPGIGFGKTVEHNLQLLNRLDELVAIGRPIVIGVSRKSFIGRLTGAEPAERVPGTIAANVIALDRGATVFRVHDVEAAVQSLTVAGAILNSPVPPARQPSDEADAAGSAGVILGQ